MTFKIPSYYQMVGLLLTYFLTTTAWFTPLATNNSVIPILRFAPTSITASTTMCDEVITENFEIFNDGVDDLNWDIISEIVVFEDDFNDGIDPNWASVTGGATSGDCSPFEGTSLLFDLSDNRIATTPALNLSGNTIIEFYFKVSDGSDGCNGAESGEDVVLEYSTDGNNWIQIQFYNENNYPNYTLIQETIPAEAVTSSTAFRWRQLTFSTPDFDNWGLDNVKIITNTDISVDSEVVSFDRLSGTISGGSSEVVTIELNSEGLAAGTYNYSFQLLSNDPSSSNNIVPITFTVQGTAVLETNPVDLDFGTLQRGEEQTLDITLTNTGCATLNITSFNFSNTDFSTNISQLTLEPEEDHLLPVTLMANVTQTYDETLTLMSNVADVIINLDAEVTPGPQIVINPTEINTVFQNCDEKATFTIDIQNQGDAVLNTTLVEPSNNLAALLSNLQVNHTSISSLIPNRFNFSDGISGVSISDGGNDMYDGGNSLNTNFANSILYSNEVITENNAFGEGSAYFTAKFPGLFVLAANMNMVSQFFISGGLGADGGGAYDIANLEREKNGIVYSGYIKRVYNAGDPSVNHLIITEKNASISHTVSNSTDLDNDNLNNLENNERLYYLLFAGSNGQYIDDAEIDAIFAAFLEELPPISIFSSDSFVTPSPIQQSVAVGGTEELTIDLDATGLETGTYQLILNMETNDAGQALVEIPVNLEVVGAPVADLPVNSIDFGDVPRSTTSKDTVYLYNSGCANLVIEDFQLDEPAFVDLVTQSTIFSGDSALIEICFTPQEERIYTGQLILETNEGDLSIALQGNGTGIPKMTVEPNVLSYQITACEEMPTLTFFIDNDGEAPLDWMIVQENNNAFQDNFDNGIDFSQWVTNSGTTIDNDCGSFSGDALLMTGSTRLAQTKTLNTINGGSVQFYLKIGNASVCEDADSGEDVVLEYATDGNNNWVNMGTFDTESYGQFSLVNLVIPNGARANNTQFRWRQPSFSGSGTDEWAIDEVIIALNVDENEDNINDIFSFNASSGTLVEGDQQQIDFSLTEPLTEGNYTYFFNVSGNDPNNPEERVRVDFEVLNRSKIRVSDNILDFGTIPVGSTTSRSVTIFNDGCDVLNLTDYSFSHPDFSSPNGLGSIAVGGSLAITVDFSPTEERDYFNFLTISNSDQAVDIALQGAVQGAPIANTTPQALSYTAEFCPIPNLPNFTVSNDGNADLSYSLKPVKSSSFSSQLSYSNSPTNSTTHYFSRIGNLKSEDEVIVKITLNGDYNAQDENATLFIGGHEEEVGIINDNNVPNGTAIVVEYTFTGQDLVRYTEDGDLQVKLKNSATVDNDSGGSHIHRVDITIREFIPYISIQSDSNTLGEDETETHQLVFTDPPTNGTYDLLIEVTTNDPANPTIDIPLTLNMAADYLTIEETETCNPDEIMSMEEVFVAENGCDSTVITRVVYKTGSPTAFCSLGLDIDLPPSGAVEVRASDLDSGSTDICGEEVRVSFSPNVNDNIRVFDCTKEGNNFIQLWATDRNGNKSFCESIIRVRNDGDDVCTCEDLYILNDQMIPPGLYKVEQFIRSNGTVETGTDVSFVAKNTVIMQAGFTVEPGATFLATIAPCYDTNVDNEEEIVERSNEENSYETLEVQNDLSIAPNPTRDLTTITYAVNQDAPVSIYVYNARGQQIKALLEGVNKAKGQYRMDINASGLATGMYYVRMQVGSESLSKKMLIIQ